MVQQHDPYVSGRATDLAANAPGHRMQAVRAETALRPGHRARTETRPSLRGFQTQSVVIIGTGMVGTSVGLALRERGVAVRLVDRDPHAARLAEARGAGSTAPQSGPADVAVLAVPPTQVAPVLREAQIRGLARSYTDVASVKGRPLAEAEATGCDLATYVGGHPLAGSEKSGPSAALATLFEGRPWVLTPTEESTAAATERAFEVVRLCGARPVVMEHGDHDR